VKFKKGETVIYPQHGACVVQGTKKMEFFGEKQDYLILKTVINEMTLKVPISSTDEVGVRPPVSADELEDLVAVLAKPDPRVPSNWSRRVKNHQEKLKSGDVSAEEAEAYLDDALAKGVLKAPPAEAKKKK
jgi:CarD family transcriptional regulator